MPDEQTKQQLKEVGVVLLDYVPDNTYTAIVGHTLTKDFFILNNISFVHQVNPEWKIAGDVKAKLSERAANIDLNVSVLQTHLCKKLSSLFKV